PWTTSTTPATPSSRTASPSTARRATAAWRSSARRTASRSNCSRPATRCRQPNPGPACPTPVPGKLAPHPQRLTVTRRAWPLPTAHGVAAAADVVVAELSDVESRGRGEAVPLRRYGESIDSVVAALDAMKGAVFSGLDRDTLQQAMPPGAARNALDCAFWDMDAKRAYRSVAELAGLGAV